MVTSGTWVVGALYRHPKGFIEYLGNGRGKGRWKDIYFDEFTIPDPTGWTRYHPKPTRL